MARKTFYQRSSGAVGPNSLAKARERAAGPVNCHQVDGDSSATSVAPSPHLSSSFSSSSVSYGGGEPLRTPKPTAPRAEEDDPRELARRSYARGRGSSKLLGTPLPGEDDEKDKRKGKRGDRSILQVMMQLAVYICLPIKHLLLDTKPFSPLAKMRLRDMERKMEQITELQAGGMVDPCPQKQGLLPLPKPRPYTYGYLDPIGEYFVNLDKESSPNVNKASGSASGPVPPEPVDPPLPLIWPLIFEDKKEELKPLSLDAEEEITWHAPSEPVLEESADDAAEKKQASIKEPPELPDDSALASAGAATGDNGSALADEGIKAHAEGFVDAKTSKPPAAVAEHSSEDAATTSGGLAQGTHIDVSAGDVVRARSAVAGLAPRIPSNCATQAEALGQDINKCYAEGTTPASGTPGVQLSPELTLSSVADFAKASETVPPVPL